MHFHLLAYDATDEGAPDRRQKARHAHLAHVEKAHALGQILFGAALLDDNGLMIGSAQFFDFPDRAGLDAYLAAEPYIIHNVWDKITITPCAIGPSFVKKGA